MLLRSMKHLEIFPYLLHNYLLFNKVIVDTELRTIGLDNYIIVKCDIHPKWVWWYIKEAEKEENFININISKFVEFKFKAPKKYNWYIPLIYNSGLSVMDKEHTYRYFINKETRAARESSSGLFYLLILKTWFSRYLRLPLESLYCSYALLHGVSLYKTFSQYGTPSYGPDLISLKISISGATEIVSNRVPKGLDAVPIPLT